MGVVELIQEMRNPRKNNAHGPESMGLDWSIVALQHWVCFCCTAK